MIKLNRLPVIICLLIAPSFGWSQDVSTQIEKKAVLVENFTGINCGYCSHGHTIVHNLLVSQPGNIYSIAIHAGDFAAPSSGQPDFRVPEGTTINNEFGISSYPSGCISRTTIEGKMVLDRGAWTKSSKLIHSEDAPVNLHLSSVYNGATQELSVTVEGYYTMPVEDDVQYLSVAYVENNISGPQSGGSSNYVHMHMLRGFISPVWGDAIEAPQQGAYFTKEYAFTIPESINNIEVKPENIEVIAFVSREKTDILNVTGRKPEYINFENPLSALVLAPEFGIKSRYAFNYFDAQLQNQSNVAITKAEFQITINGIAQNVAWTGSVHSFETQPIRLHVDNYDIESSNAYSIKLLSLNGQAIDGNSINGTFAAPYESTPKFIFEIQTDLYADENRFLIKNRNGEVVKEIGPYPAGLKKIYTEEIELEANQTYGIEITDAWGDGIQLPRGYLKITTADGTMLFQDFSIEKFGTRYAINTSQPTSLAALTSEQTKCHYNKSHQQIELELSTTQFNVRIAVYNISGRLMYESRSTNAFHVIPTNAFVPGCYIVHLQNGLQKENHKVIIY